MASVAQTTAFENEPSSIIDAFFHTFRLAALLKCAGACKMEGVSAAKLFRELFSFVFLHHTMLQSVSSASQEAGGIEELLAVDVRKLRWS